MGKCSNEIKACARLSRTNDFHAKYCLAPRICKHKFVKRTVLFCKNGTDGIRTDGMQKSFLAEGRRFLGQDSP
jgi:hypothetical protein